MAEGVPAVEGGEGFPAYVAVAEIELGQLGVLHEVVGLPEAARQDHVAVTDVVEVNAVHGGVCRQCADKAAQVFAHRLPRRADPPVVADVGRPRQRGFEVAADGEPLGMVGLRPLIAVAVQRPEPAVVCEALSVGGLRDEVDVAPADQNGVEAGFLEPREPAAPLDRVVVAAAVHPGPGGERRPRGGSR